MSTTTPGTPGVSGRAAVPGPDGGSGAGGGRLVGRAAVPAPPDDHAPEAVPGPPGGRPPARVGRRRRRWRRALLASALVLLLVLALGAGGLWLYSRSLAGNMDRVEVFSELTGERPTKPVAGTRNILVLGSDSRDPDADPQGGYRADTIMLMHAPSGGKQAYLISLPRDLWVPIPPTADGSDGGYEAKINAATAIGGVPLAVQTVEGYTGVRVDNVMLLDFAGFVEVTDALGGVEMRIDQTITSIHKPNRTFEQGTHELTGEEALDYIRQRKQFADGDFTRMRNQQQFLRKLMDKAASTGTLSNPARLNAFLQTATRTLTVDEDFSLLDMGWQFRSLRSSNLTFLTSPHAGTGRIDGQSVVVSDDAAAADLYAAVREDRMGRWVTEHPDRVGG